MTRFNSEILEKILFNLLSNAFIFTPLEGEIKLRMRITRNQATISVKDTGMGISPEELPFVFDRFFTSKAAEKSHYTGTGIGLSFTKMLTEAHHGTIEVKSQKGKYNEFSVTIPVDSESYSQEEHAAAPIVNEPKQNNVPVYIEPVTADFPDDEESDTDAELMLVVEDNDEIANYLIQQFSDDFKVYRANNGQDGCEMARKLIHDIIISDIMMDKMTWLELCTKVKRDMITTHIPVILLTELISDDNKMDGLEVGADAYVEKPFEIKYLHTVVNNLLKQRAAMKEKYLLENIHLAGGAGNKTDSMFLAKVEEILESHCSDPDFSIVTLSEKLNVSRTSSPVKKV
jgi:CheY-like chemotaxis protein